eukprot:TRINITY_DN62214_c0_g1_i2.p1 TRINITY_DN62214_c0_g1~~TRINITY_DN62214_c0_g1_i2.p1  ORF type:complete len:130 (+),score=39.04 TRINITY_DN62214_c0_g1_i2:175-564(+)
MCIRDRYMGNTGVKRKKAYSSAESEGERITENFYFNLLEYIVFLYIKFLSIDEKDCKMPVMQVTEYKKLRVMIEKRVKELMERYKIKKKDFFQIWENTLAVSYTHLRAHETSLHLVCRLLLEKKKKPTS